MVKRRTDIGSVNDELLKRYQQAQSLEQGAMSKTLVLNDAVFAHWIGNTECFWYERETREEKDSPKNGDGGTESETNTESSTVLGKEYRLVDAKEATNNTAFDHKSLACALVKASGQQVDPRNLPITVVDITLSPQQIHFQAFEKHWVFAADRKNCEVVQITTVDGLCSPDGRKAAFVRDHNLWVRELTSGAEHALTKEGKANSPYATAATPFGPMSTPALQALWSSDSQHLLTHQLDITSVSSRERVHLVPQDGRIQSQLSEYKTAYPGDKTIEAYRLVAINVKTGKAQTANYERLPLCRAGAGFFTEESFGWWANDCRRAFFVDVARGAQTVSIVEFDTQTGKTRIIFEETSDTFVKLSHDLFDNPLFLPLHDTDELIWFSERKGWGHLYLYDLNTGQLKHSLTTGEWLVRNILHIDVKRRELWIQTAGRNSTISPYYRDICRVQLDTGAITPLAKGPYDYSVFSADSGQVQMRIAFGLDTPGICGVSPSGNYLVTTRSRVDKIPVSLLIDREGKELLTLETSDPFGLPAGWQWPEPFTLKSADGKTDLYGTIYRPPGFSPEKQYPVLDFSCAHPGFSFVAHAAFVNAPYCGEPYQLGAAYAALGFVVVAIEVPGMPCRHKAFQDESYGCMVSVNAFEDRIAAFQQLEKRYPYMDLDRVGIVGVDGISGPVYGLLKHPEFYKVGVMIALEDARFLTASIAELFEGAPPHSKTPYAETMVNQLQGKLLLIHGMRDTLTPPEATFRLIDALQKANKDFDLLLLPNDGHEISNYALRRSWDYLVTHLQGETPPKEFKLTTTFG